MTATIYDLLPTGEQNALTARELMNRTGYADARAMREQIRRERLEGALILSTKGNGGGYYRPGSAAELRAFIQTYEREADSTKAMLQAAKQALEGGEYR